MTDAPPLAKILIADDQATIRLLVETALAPLPCEVFTASNGLEALEIARDRSPDLLILDWVMPGASGLEVTQSLRDSGVSAPVILLTARGLRADRAIALQYGIDEFIPKPFSPTRLVETVARTLEFDAAIPAATEVERA